MHQVFSTILSFILSPFNWIVILVAGGYIFRKGPLKRICRIAALCLFLLFSNAWFLDWYAKKWQPLPYVDNPAVIYSCGIVPGGFGSPDDNGDGHFNATADRFIQAVKLYKLGRINHILISGGNGKVTKENFREGAWVKGELNVMGIPDSAIFVEDRSANTADNAIYAKKILDSLQLKPPYLLITSAYHVPRASLLFENAGLSTVPFPCNYISGKAITSFPSSFLPEPAVLSGWNIYLKEAAGYFWYRLSSKKN